MVLCILLVSLACGCSTRLGFEARLKRGETILVTRVDPAHVAVAEPIHCLFEVTAPEGVAVAFPSEREWLGEFKVLESTRLIDVPLDQQRMSRWQMTLESYTSGSVQLPTVAIAITDGRGAFPVQEVIQTPPVEIKVEGVRNSLLGRPEFQEVEGPLPPPVGWSFWIAVASSIVALALILKIGQAILGTHRRRRAAWREASQRLAALHDFLRREPEQADVALAELISILRTFYARTLGTRTQATSEELLADLARPNSTPLSLGRGAGGEGNRWTSNGRLRSSSGDGDVVKDRASRQGVPSPLSPLPRERGTGFISRFMVRSGLVRTLLEQDSPIGGQELNELRAVLERADRLNYGHKAAYLGEARELIRRSQRLVDSHVDRLRPGSSENGSDHDLTGTTVREAP